MSEAMIVQAVPGSSTWAPCGCRAPDDFGDEAAGIHAMACPTFAANHHEVLTPEPIWLVVSDVAKRAGVTREAVRAWHKQGKLKPHGWTLSGIRLFHRAEVDRYLAQRGTKRDTVE